MQNAPWYETSFQKEYQVLYQHRNDETARKEIYSLIKGLNLPRKGKVLDVCCGNGRHSRVLAEMGYEVTGVDLSSDLLNIAKKRNTFHRIRYIKYDIRDLPYDGEFDITFNLFTSFGYFSSDEKNELAMQRIARSVKPGGHVVIDFLNPEYVKNHLVPFSTRKIGEIEIEEKRWIADGFVYKKIIYRDPKGTKEFMERVRLYSVAAMTSFLQKAGIVNIMVYGDFDLRPYSPESSRMIIHGRKGERV